MQLEADQRLERERHLRAQLPTDPNAFDIPLRSHYYRERHTGGVTAALLAFPG